MHGLAVEPPASEEVKAHPARRYGAGGRLRDRHLLGQRPAVRHGERDKNGVVGGRLRASRLAGTDAMVGSAGSNGLAVWVPAAIRSPITSNEALGVALDCVSDGLGVVVGAESAMQRPSSRFLDRPSNRQSRASRRWQLKMSASSLRPLRSSGFGGYSPSDRVATDVPSLVDRAEPEGWDRFSKLPAQTMTRTTGRPRRPSALACHR